MYKVTSRKVSKFLDCCKNAKINIELKEKISLVKHYGRSGYRKMMINMATYLFIYAVGEWRGYIVDGKFLTEQEIFGDCE